MRRGHPWSVHDGASFAELFRKREQQEQAEMPTGPIPAEAKVVHLASLQGGMLPTRGELAAIEPFERGLARPTGYNRAWSVHCGEAFANHVLRGCGRAPNERVLLLVNPDRLPVRLPPPSDADSALAAPSVRRWWNLRRLNLRRAASQEKSAARSALPSRVLAAAVGDSQAVDVGTVRDWLSGGGSVDAVSDSGWTLLMAAVNFGHRLLALELLQRGASPHTRQPRGSTALHLASLQGLPKMVSLLLEARADVNAQDDKGVSPIMVATLKGHAAIVQLLMRAGTLT